MQNRTTVVTIDSCRWNALALRQVCEQSSLSNGDATQTTRGSSWPDSASHLSSAARPQRPNSRILGASAAR